MTPYNLLRERCGLSQREAAEYHAVRPDTVQSWGKLSGNRAPESVLQELRDLYARIEAAADQALARIAQEPPGTIFELALTADDTEARGLGWPCVGAQAAMLGLVLARHRGPARVVHRGTTRATAGTR